jgi:hypothetical protein
MNCFEEVVGKTLATIHAREDEVRFTFTDGTAALLYHNQDCCESVTLYDIAGDLGDLIGTPILKAEESSNSDDPPEGRYYPPDSFTWTFYLLATVKGHVTLRWYGESNGYYSEGVSFREVRG